MTMTYSFFSIKSAIHRFFITAVGILCFSFNVSGFEINVDFEDLDLAPDSYYNGSDGAGGFTSNSVNFNNSFNTDYNSWEGWAYSNISDTSTLGWGNQYASFPGSGANHSDTYSIGYVGFSVVPMISFSTPGTVSGAFFSNTTYAGTTMVFGDGFAKQFGGVDGNDEDWFLLTATGLDVNSQITGTVDYYLADFRFESNDQDYISNSWVWVDLSGLGHNVSSIKFGLASSDNGEFGMNTPGYFAIDGLQAIPEPSVITLTFLGIGLIWFWKRLP